MSRPSKTTSAERPAIEQEVFEVHRGRVRALDVSPDGRLLASIDEKGTLILWDLVPELKVRWSTQTHDRYGHTVAFLGNERIVTSGGGWESHVPVDDEVFVFDLRGEPTEYFQACAGPGAVGALSATTDGSRLAIRWSDSDGHAYTSLYDTTGPARHDRTLRYCNQLLFDGSSGGYLALFGRRIVVAPGPSGKETELGTAPKYARLLGLHVGRLAVGFEVPAGERPVAVSIGALRDFRAATRYVLDKAVSHSQLSISRDLERIAFASLEGTQIRDLATSRVDTLRFSKASALAFGLEKSELFIGGLDKTLRRCRLSEPPE